MRTAPILRALGVLFLGALAHCRPTAGYGTTPVTSSNQFPPPPHSIEQGNDSTTITPPAGGAPGQREADAGLPVGPGSLLWPTRQARTAQ